MKTWSIGIGREVNRPTVAATKRDARGVELLTEAEWEDVRAELEEAASAYGRILFRGIGHGRNTVTGQDEEGFCLVLEPNVTGIGHFKRTIADIAAAYGQVEVAITSGSSECVKGACPSADIAAAFADSVEGESDGV